MKILKKFFAVCVLLLAASDLLAEATKNSSVELSRQRMEQQQAQIQFRKLENEHRQQMQMLKRFQEKKEAERLIENAQNHLMKNQR
jgi:hypothetical protein